jgi:hypothetical protein
MKKLMLICTILTLVPLLAGCAYRHYPYRDGYYSGRYDGGYYGDRYYGRDRDGYYGDRDRYRYRDDRDRTGNYDRDYDR